MSVVVAEGLTARIDREAVVGASFALGPGMHALLGAKDEGSRAALAALAGATRARKGRATVLGRAACDPRTRAGIAYVPRDPCWPDALRVDDALATALALRRGRADGGADGRAWANAALARFGLAALAPRRGRSLAPEELRAVALVEAVSAPAVRVILVEEPRVQVDPRASAALLEALGAKARAGACVVLATASARDAGELCESVVLFARAAVVRHTTAAEPAPVGPGRVRVVAHDARALVAHLAGMDNVTTLSLQGDAVLVGAVDLRAAVDAVARAAVATGSDVRELVPIAGAR